MVWRRCKMRGIGVAEECERKVEERCRDEEWREADRRSRKRRVGSRAWRRIGRAEEERMREEERK